MFRRKHQNVGVDVSSTVGGSAVCVGNNGGGLEKGEDGVRGGDTSSLESTPKKKPVKLKPILIETSRDWEMLVESSETRLQSQSAFGLTGSDSEDVLCTPRSQFTGVHIDDFLVSAGRKDSLLEQLGTSLRHGFLSKSSPAWRLRVLRMLDRHWKELCSGGVENNRVRMIYETVRDYSGNVLAGDSKEEAVQLSSAALVSLTRMIIVLNMPQRDPRLVKFHIERLFRLLRGNAEESNGGEFVVVASKCLCMMEEEFPTIISLQAEYVMQEAMTTEDKTALNGFPKTTLALMAVAHICEAYEKQQQQQEEKENEDVVSNSGSSSPTTTACHAFGSSHSSRRSASCSDATARTGTLPLLDEGRYEKKGYPRFHMPDHFCAGTVPFYQVDLVLTDFAVEKIKELFLFALQCMKRMNRDTIQKMSPHLQVLLRFSGMCPLDLWSVVHDLIQTGNTSILEFVLDTHDNLPGFFEGRRPCLLEKILVRSNDQSFSIQHRQMCLRWILRQHAIQCHEKSDFLLGDCWVQLLPQDNESIETVALKVKALAACLRSGIGDPQDIARAICLWPGFENESYSGQFAYALRLLYGVTAESSVPMYRLEASLIRSISQALVIRPRLVKVVYEFLDICEEEFETNFNTGFQALITTLDGQFEVLRHKSEAERYNNKTSSKVKASVLSRASSVSGMVRGLSFKLMKGSASQYRSSLLDSGSSSGRHGPVSRDSSGRSLGRSLTEVDNNSQLGKRDADVTSLLGAQDFPAAEELVVVEPEDLIPEFQSLESLTEWLVSPYTWRYLTHALLKQDLMTYRTLLHRILRCGDICPCGVLRSISNYAWQYEAYDVTHSLFTKECGNAILALTQTAALAHLPILDDTHIQRTDEQLEVVESLMEVLDAIQEGFPCPSTLKRANVLGMLISDERAWTPSRTSATLASILAGFIDAAIAG